MDPDTAVGGTLARWAWSELGRSQEQVLSWWACLEVGGRYGMDGEVLGSTAGFLLWWAWLKLMDLPLAGLRPDWT